MEQVEIQIGPVQYLLARNYVGERNLKDVVLEKMVAAQPEPHSTESAAM